MNEVILYLNVIKSVSSDIGVPSKRVGWQCGYQSTSGWRLAFNDLSYVEFPVHFLCQHIAKMVPSQLKLFGSVTIDLKYKKRGIKLNSPHFMKLNSLFMGRTGRPEGRKYFGPNPPMTNFATKDLFCDYCDFCCWQPFGLYAQKIPVELVDLESVEMCDQTKSDIFWWWSI